MKKPADRMRAGPTNTKKGRTAGKWIHAAGGAVIVVAVGALAFESGFIPYSASQHAQTGPVTADFFQPPSDDKIPDDKFGQAVRRGQAIFMNTATNASDHVGNGLSCSNCHLGGGKQPYSAPMWAAWVQYPKYRSKNDQINTMEDRIKGCFSYSMNAQHSISGGPPATGDDIYRDLQTYIYWLATNAPTNMKMKGAGFGKVPKTEAGYSAERGEIIFATNCAVCHGADGQGQKDVNARYVFPPLWGADSYNWGAGMARIDTAAAFIKHNMPLSQPGKLTDQEAWDVAAFIDSHERPKDPRQKHNTIEATRKRYHDGDETYYGKTINGNLLGVGTPDPEPRVQSRE
ncbi:MAG: c-type cytochrome [Brucella anthropi]